MIKSELKLHRNFIKATISSRLKCPICFEVFFKPRRLFCGHTFCKSCLQELCNKIHHKNPQHINTCPLCRTPIDFNNIAYDLFAKRIIDELQVSCPVNGCPWKGQNQLLQTHYRFQCKMKNYVKKLSKQNKNIDTLVQQEFVNKQDDIRQRINQNIQKGSLISRVISKNPHLLQTNDDRLSHKSKVIPKKNLITRSTQTYPVRIIPINRKKDIKVPKFYKAPIDINNPIIPMNGVTPIPTYVFQSNKPSMLTRIKRQSQKPLNSSQQQKDIQQLYVQMGLNFYDSNNQVDVEQIISSQGANDDSSLQDRD